MRVGYIYDDIYTQHDTGIFHPESKERLRAIEKEIKTIKDKLVLIELIEASAKIIHLVHPYSHIETIEEASSNQKQIDADTITSASSYKAACKAVGAGVVAIDAFKKGQIDRAFAAVRPPGHHATIDRAMGFCLFNSIAIAARYAQSQGYSKVFIVDFDVHHGNGTQDIFYDDDSVFYFSSHQSPAYPGTGYEDDVGVGRGKGFTSNHMLMPESGDEEILDIYHNDLPKLVQSFDPDIILVSAGYDLHESDPLASLNITTNGIAQIVEAILKTKADIPYLFMLEGGYDVEALGKNVRVTIEKMRGDTL